MNISGEIALQNKHDLMCHVAKVKAATSAHSMADVIPLFSVFNIPFKSNASIRSNEKYFMHNKENNIRNIFRTLMFQQLLANKHHRLRDSVPITIWPSGGLRLVTDIKKTRSCYSNLKPRLYFFANAQLSSSKVRAKFNLFAL